MMISDQLHELAEKVRQIEQARMGSPHASAFAVIVAAEVVARDGYVPSQRALNRLRNAIDVYHVAIGVQKVLAEQSSTDKLEA